MLEHKSKSLMDLYSLEETLSFETFRHIDALNIALLILNRVKQEQLRRIAIRVVYKDLLIFQYLMDGKEEDTWLKRKQHTVETFKHSSLSVWQENQETGKHEEYKTNEKFAICGGGFPIIEKGEMAGTFCVSGLAHDMDHQLIVDAFTQYLKYIKEGSGK